MEVDLVVGDSLPLEDRQIYDISMSAELQELSSNDLKLHAHPVTYMSRELADALGMEQGTRGHLTWHPY